MNHDQIVWAALDVAHDAEASYAKLIHQDHAGAQAALAICAAFRTFATYLEEA